MRLKTTAQTNKAEKYILKIMLSECKIFFALR